MVGWVWGVDLLAGCVLAGCGGCGGLIGLSGPATPGVVAFGARFGCPGMSDMLCERQVCVGCVGWVVVVLRVHGSCCCCAPGLGLGLMFLTSKGWGHGVDVTGGGGVA